jgi:hypothetical protein
MTIKFVSFVTMFYTVSPPYVGIVTCVLTNVVKKLKKKNQKKFQNDLLSIPMSLILFSVKQMVPPKQGKLW